LTIINSQLEENPRTSVGVAFIINKDLVDANQINKHELIKGRAIAIKLTWKHKEMLLVNVYALNNKHENQRFWETVDWERLSHHLRKPDFILGDFNLMEEPIDQSPPKHDNAGAKNTLRDFRITTGILDQWRHAYPKAREFTYHAMIDNKPIKSHLDRIYVSKEKAKFTFNWLILPSSVPTDHWLVTVRYALKNSPYIGKGRWTTPLQILNDKTTMNHIEVRGLKLQEDIEQISIRTDQNNAQILWHKFKLNTIMRLDYEAKKANYKY
ncbi:Endonuclease/exonuclease/phosphatase, partial [Lactarius sanguifluus]